MLPGRQPLHYYFCTNLQPEKNSEFKTNWSVLILQAMSFAIHILVNVKIRIFKVKQKQFVGALTFSDHMKFGDILSMESRSISDYMTSILAVVASSSFFIISSIINHHTNPYEFNQVRFYIILCDLSFFYKIMAITSHTNPYEFNQVTFQHM
jgi:hypothetical protein